MLTDSYMLSLLYWLQRRSGRTLESNILPSFLSHDCKFRTPTDPALESTSYTQRPQFDKRQSPLDGGSERALKLPRNNLTDSQSTLLDVVTKAISSNTNQPPNDFSNTTSERNDRKGIVATDMELDIATNDKTPTGTLSVSASAQSTPTPCQSVPAGTPVTPKLRNKRVSKPTEGVKKEEWGHLKHRFNFLSAYKHSNIQRLRPDYIPEVTTQHGYGQGTNVDYIFFTG